MVYDTDKQKMKIEATVPDGQYLAIGYGRGMSNKDMVFFPGSSSDLKDLYSISYRTPSVDSSSAYVDTEKVSSNGVHSYTTYRALSTGDVKDFKIDCGKTHDFAWVGHSSSSSMIKHNKKGSFLLKLNDDCSVVTDDD